METNNFELQDLFWHLPFSRVLDTYVVLKANYLVYNNRIFNTMNSNQWYFILKNNQH